ncbi:MAG: peptide chain release factor 1 [Planctomycetaceae bacterium]|nr:peptide chain release factor 1 [Planctomycetaceae bacterium]
MALAEALFAKLREAKARYDELTALLSQEGGVEGRRLPGILRERGALEKRVELLARLDELAKRREDAQAMLSDPEMAALAKEELAALEEDERNVDQEAVDALIAEEDDNRRKVIMEIRAGTGGDEASLFAADLFRLYQYYFDSQGWKYEVFDASPSDVGGFKEITLSVEGEGTWRKLRFESGGHRVQRVPATESQGRIHTSAATVAVLPEAEEVDLEINPGDLRIDTMRAGGAGGQHVNKTESAVRITHLPTGTMVVCMDEKSQHKNRARAMRVLRSRLYEAERARQAAERAAMRKTQIGTGDRNARIRTYNFPQNRLTDHRANENYSLEHVMAGKLEPVVVDLLALEREERINNL